MKLGIGLGSISHGREAARSADGIPLDALGPAGAQTVVSMMALLGLTQSMLCLVCVLALVRFRAMIPLTLSVLPGTPPGLAVNLVILALMIAGLALSLRTRRGDLAGA